jgi:hypothetical protein
MWREMRRLVSSPALFVAAVAAYALLRLSAVLASSPFIDYDSDQYARVAAHPLWSRGFLAGEKPFVLPLLWKLLPGPAVHVSPNLVYGDIVPALMGQVVVSIACWTVLALVIARSLRHFGARVLAVTAILGFSCSMGITQWDHTLISESLSLSLLALLIAAALVLMQRPSGLTVTLALGAMFLWAFTRDTNALFVAIAGPLLALVLARRGWMRLALPLAVGALVLAGAGRTTAELAARGGLPTRNVMVFKLATDPQFERYFVAHGMPNQPGLAQRLGQRPPNLYFTDRRLVQFRRWFARSGERTYDEWLLSHPGKLFGPPLRSFGRLYTPKPSELAVYRDYRPLPRVLPAWVDPLFFPGSSAGLAALLALAVAGLAFACARGRVTRLDAVPLAFLAATLPVAIFIWHGDAAELDLHLFQGTALTRLSLLVLVLLAADRVLEWVHADATLPSVLQPDKGAA